MLWPAPCISNTIPLQLFEHLMYTSDWGRSGWVGVLEQMKAKMHGQEERDLASYRVALSLMLNHMQPD